MTLAISSLDTLIVHVVVIRTRGFFSRGLVLIVVLIIESGLSMCVAHHWFKLLYEWIMHRDALLS